MKKLLLCGAAILSFAATFAEPLAINIDGQDYAVDTLVERQVGPGTMYRRLRIPQYPLNINMLQVDVTNPNVRIETTQANDKLFGTERLVDAAARQSAPGHRPFAGANGNFWCVTTSYPYSDYLVGTTFNANLRNGMIITETNCAANQWDRGPEYIGELGVTPEGKVYSDHFRWAGTVTSDAFGSENIEGANKLVHANEIVMFNRYYGATNTMKCADMVWRDGSNRWGFDLVHEAATEVYFTLVPGQEWSAGRPIEFEAAKIEDNTDMGTPDDYDLVLVGRDSRRDALRKLAPGDRVSLVYSWTTLDGTPIEFENMIGGNGQVMIDGELTELNTISENCALVYSKVGYGSSADHNTLYIFVIDKSTDPVYGVSSGCTSAVMCQIARHYGCSNLTNFDSGGSAMMYITDRIINTTTEGTPRAVANGMFVYSTAPDDDVITRLEFAERAIRVPTYATVTPQILGYNKYGVLVSTEVEGVTFSCEDALGSTANNASLFVAGSHAATGVLTAHLGDVEVSKQIEVVESEFSFRLPYMVVDEIAEPILFTSTVDGNEFVYKPANVYWTVDLPDGATSPIEVDDEGNIRAVGTGEVTLTASIGDRRAQAVISAEPTPKTVTYLQDTFVPEEWSFTKASVSNPVMTAISGGFALDFNVTSTRGPRVVAAKDIRLYSMPRTISVTLNTGDKTMAAPSITVLMANSKRTTSITMEQVGDTDTYVAELWSGERDVAIFPITFNNIQLNPTNSGQHHVEFTDFIIGYDTTEGVEAITFDGASQSDADGLYNLQGIKVNPDRPAPGIYISRNGNTTEKVLIR